MHLFKKKTPEQPTEERLAKELLRENLNAIQIDIFYGSDPLVGMSPEERKVYLLYWHNLKNDGKFVERLKFLINTQATQTLSNARTEGKFDMPGAMSINGIATVFDDLDRLSMMYLKENPPGGIVFDKHKVFSG